MSTKNLLALTVLVASLGCRENKDRKAEPVPEIVPEGPVTLVDSMELISGTWMTDITRSAANGYIKVVHIPESVGERGVVQIYRGSTLEAEAYLNFAFKNDGQKNSLSLVVDEVTINKKLDNGSHVSHFAGREEVWTSLGLAGQKLKLDAGRSADLFISHFGLERTQSGDEKNSLVRYDSTNGLVRSTCAIPNLMVQAVCDLQLGDSICSKQVEEVALANDQGPEKSYAGRWSAYSKSGEALRCRVVPANYLP
ncbi:MAG: hypothetical protein M3Q07_09000 [Pseudobdellovibrionaceae bacterium]|nr:hypothetical protein [Pseudobdellovibrionaceae bacterium]